MLSLLANPEGLHPDAVTLRSKKYNISKPKREKERCVSSKEMIIYLDQQNLAHPQDVQNKTRPQHS
jgi:hypothetical protein